MKKRTELYKDGQLVSVNERDYTPDEIKAMAIKELANTDKDMARAAEDIINLLVTKNLITAEEIPVAVKTKLDYRKTLRERLK